MTPHPLGRHQHLLSMFLLELGTAIRVAKCNASTIVELDWVVRDDTIVRPDLVVVCGPPPEKHLRETPSPVAEILSQSTKRNDQTYKKQLYEREGVATYVMLDPETATAEHLSLGRDGYENVVHEATLRLRLCKDCEVEIDVNALF